MSLCNETTDECLCQPYYLTLEHLKSSYKVYGMQDCWKILKLVIPRMGIAKQHILVSPQLKLRGIYDMNTWKMQQPADILNSFSSMIHPYPYPQYTISTIHPIAHFGIWSIFLYECQYTCPRVHNMWQLATGQFSYQLRLRTVSTSGVLQLAISSHVLVWPCYLHCQIFRSSNKRYWLQTFRDVIYYKQTITITITQSFLYCNYYYIIFNLLRLLLHGYPLLFQSLLSLLLLFFINKQT